MMNNIILKGLVSLAFSLPAIAQEITQPSLDLTNYGEKLFLLGNFDSYSIYDSTDRNFTSESNDNSSSIFFISPTGNVSDIQYASSIELDEIPSSTYLINSTLFLAIVEGQPVIYDLNTLETKELDDWSSSISGDAITAYVDQQNQVIYLGGNFVYQDTTYSAIAYDVAENSLYDLPFQGFGEGSSVNSILKIVDTSDEKDGSIIFGGYFDTIGNEDLLYTNSTNSTTSNNNSTVYIDPDQLISLKSAAFSSVNSVTNNDADLICPSSSLLWSLGDSQLGSWTVSLQNKVEPAKIRLYNPEDSSNGVQYFRVITTPSNGIMNMSYIDPESLEISYCDSFCPLLLQATLSDDLESVIEQYESDPNELDGIVSDNIYFQNSNNEKGFLGFGSNYQEFSFINFLEVDSLTIQILDYYGSAASLSGFELLQYGIYTYANNTFNEANCDSSSEFSTSSLSSASSWSSYEDIDGSHLTTRVSQSDIDSNIGVVFYPTIENTGFYSILLYTPGCSYDNTCNFRGIVNATLFSGNGTVLSTNLIYQNNDALKYDTIFSGEISSYDLVASDGSVSPPYVTMYLHSSIDSDSDDIVVVADKIYVEFNSVNISPNATTIETSSKVPLNGLFEYSLSNFSYFLTLDEDDELSTTNISFIGNSSLNILGSQILSKGANISSLALVNSTLFIAGDFDSDYGYNFVAADIGDTYSRLNESTITGEETIKGFGLNGIVNKIYPVGHALIVIGDFDSTENSTTIEEYTNSTSISHLALYLNDTWISLGESVGSDSIMTNLTFNATDYLIFNGLTDELSIFDLTNIEWIDTGSSDVVLNISQALEVNETSTIVFGSLSSIDGESSGSLIITEDSIESIPLSFTDQSDFQINTGAYINGSMIVLGGKFKTDEGYQNLVFINTENNSTAGGISNLDFDDDAEVNNLFLLNNVLYIGFTGEATYKEASATDLISYAFSNSSLTLVDQSKSSSNVNRAVTNTTESSTGFIIAVEEDPQFGNLILGGNFTDLGGKSDCDTLCFFHPNNGTFSYPPDKPISGTINDLKYFTAYNVLLAGNSLKINGDTGSFALYNTKNHTLSIVSDYSDVPGAVRKFELLDNTVGGKLIALGTNFLSFYNGSSWSRLDTDLDTDSTTISDFQILALSKNRTSTTSTVLKNNETMLVTGSLDLKEYGLVSAAFFDGESWTPYLLTSDNDSSAPTVSTILKNTERQVYLGTFPSSSSFPSSSPSSSSDESEPKYFTTGQVVGVGFAMSLATMALFAGIATGVYYWTQRGTTVTPLNYRVGEEKMVNAVPPNEVLNNMAKAATTSAT